MKMSDVFDGDVIAIDSFQDGCYVDTENSGYDINDVDKHIKHAINNHDRMADEIAELREGLKLMIEQFKSEHNCEYEYKIIKWNEDLLNK